MPNHIIGSILNGAAELADRIVENNKNKLDAENEKLRIETNAKNALWIAIAPVAIKATVDIIKHQTENGMITKYYESIKGKTVSTIDYVSSSKPANLIGGAVKNVKLLGGGKAKS